jgi:hypothetical protein
MYLQIATLLTLEYASFNAFAMLNGKPKGGQELSHVWLGRKHDPLHRIHNQSNGTAMYYFGHVFVALARP